MPAFTPAAWPRRPAILGPFSSHNLIATRRIAMREIRTRIVGTALGFAHYVVTPLFYLGVYVFIFGSVFVARWTGGGDLPGDFALRVYCGLLVFQFFAEVIGRAPRLLLENPSYVTRMAFPLEILVPAAMGTALFAAAIGTAILLLGHLVLIGLPPPSVLGLVLIWPALLMFVAGLGWALSAIGVYLRDLGQLVTTVLPALMFLTPIFYPSSAVPAGLAAVLMANPLAWFVEAIRGATLDGVLPSAGGFAALYAAGFASALIGHAVFRRTRHGFADVV